MPDTDWFRPTIHLGIQEDARECRVLGSEGLDNRERTEEERQGGLKTKSADMILFLFFDVLFGWFFGGFRSTLSFRIALSTQGHSAMLIDW
jgi:hypothetical protein